MSSQGGVKGKEAEKLWKIEKDGAGSSHQGWPKGLANQDKRKKSWEKKDRLESTELMA